MAKRTLLFDIESYSADERFNMPPEKFCRLFQYAWGRDGEVQLTTDLQEMRSLLREADLVVGHNILNFDLPAVFGKDSDEPMQMALESKILDTQVWSMLVNPVGYEYTNRAGHTFYNASKPETALKFYSLDNVAYQFGVEGKLGDLTEIAKRYNPPKTKKADLDYGLIPLDDPEFLEYAIQDVKVLQEVGGELIAMTNRRKFPWHVIYREMAVTAATARISANGIPVNKEAAQARVAELTAERDRIMQWLVSEYDFPTEGKSPWSSNKGKEVIMQALADYGITPSSRPDWAKTATGNISLGGEELIRLTEDTEAETLGRALATLKGQRSLAQLALDSMHEDGKAHPNIVAIQRSWRWSVTKPGLTVWTARGDNAVEKKYFTASPGCKMVSIDYSNADARVVAAYSGDPFYGRRFKLDENGKEPDGHELNGRAGFGDKYDEDPAHYRQLAKILGHGWNYGGRAKTLARQTGVDLDIAYQFVDSMDRTFEWLVAWQNDVRAEAKIYRGEDPSGNSLQWVEDEWGYRMRVDEGREFTQSPALLGQGGTRQILADGLIKMARRDPRLLHWVVAIIHDEVLVNVPEKDLDWAIPAMVECLQTTFHPKKYGYSSPIEFKVSHGEPADDWFEAAH